MAASQFTRCPSDLPPVPSPLQGPAGTGGDSELHQLEERVAAAAGKPEAMAMLAQRMSPSLHHTAIGLMATRMYSQLLDA